MTWVQYTFQWPGKKIDAWTFICSRCPLAFERVRGKKLHAQPCPTEDSNLVFLFNSTPKTRNNLKFQEARQKIAGDLE
jgi:hypothetical protein